ncbi:hypothetical protein B0O80DRAFT_296993 [Mortierella sp. GBAus27b]|nr:hypothetical protein B0O80DRAFT_296993 [Mortierella sp. GBAus27b]
MTTALLFLVASPTLPVDPTPSAPITQAPIRHCCPTTTTIPSPRPYSKTISLPSRLTPRAKEFVNHGLARYGALNDDDLELAMAKERVREVEQRKIQDEELWHARQEDERRHQDQLWRSRMPGSWV